MKLPVVEILEFTLLLIFSLCRHFTTAALITAPNSYVWKSSSWSSCKTIGNCGFGKRVRHAICHDPTGSLEVDNSNCIESKKPSSTEDCFKVCEKHKEFLKWRIGKWSSCNPKTIHSSSVPCTGVSLPGLAERKISCIFTTTQNEVDISACEHFWDVPESKMSCSLDCPQDCVVRKKNVTCILDGCEKQHGWSREVTELVVSPSDEKSSCPKLSSETICRREMLTKICKSTQTLKKSFLLKIGDWSKCRATDRDYANGFHPGLDIRLSMQPIIGFTRRNITCITEEGVTTDLRFLAFFAATGIALFIGDWSKCRATDRDYANGFHPGLDIRLSMQPIIGFTRRNITCITEEGVTTDLSLCNVQELPVSTKKCVVPIDCEVSPWSEWRVRKEGCISSDGRIHPETRTRYRRLLQMPVGVGARPCPPLYEERNVSNDLPSCYKYQWFPLEWSNCELRIHGQHLKVYIVKPSCGSGLQYRNVTCLRANDMSPADDSYCKEAMPATIQRCKVPCKRDCQVSHWSRWGPCVITKKNKERPPDEIKGTK
nr:thrombospondin type-1 domain-containing protein 7A-like [Parasteatoda tepidariorum]